MKPYERAGLVDATDIPLAGKDSVVRPVLSIPEPRPVGRIVRGISP
jgi:hypothetical protein